jgi:hypothetical protein
MIVPTRRQDLGSSAALVRTGFRSWEVLFHGVSSLFASNDGAEQLVGLFASAPVVPLACDGEQCAR